MKGLFLLLATLAWTAPNKKLLTHLLASSWTSWESILAEHKDELDRPFFQMVEDRLAEDEENLNAADAAKCATLGDRALLVLGRCPRYSRALDVWLRDRGGGAAPSWLIPELVRAGRSGDFFASPRREWEANEPSRVQHHPSVDLTVEAEWKLVASGDQNYCLSDVLRNVRYELGDHESLLLACNVRPGPVLRCGQPELFLDGIWTGTQGGRLIWVGSRRPDSELRFGDVPVARLSDSFEFWMARLGPSQIRFQRLDSTSQVYLFRATMADIGIETQGSIVTALILMEPGQLKTELLRLGCFRQLNESR